LEGGKLLRPRIKPRRQAGNEEAANRRVAREGAHPPEAAARRGPARHRAAFGSGGWEPAGRVSPGSWEKAAEKRFEMGRTGRLTTELAGAVPVFLLGQVLFPPSHRRCGAADRRCEERGRLPPGTHRHSRKPAGA